MTDQKRKRQTRIPPALGAHPAVRNPATIAAAKNAGNIHTHADGDRFVYCPACGGIGFRVYSPVAGRPLLVGVRNATEIGKMTVNEFSFLRTIDEIVWCDGCGGRKRVPRARAAVWLLQQEAQ